MQNSYEILLPFRSLKSMRVLLHSVTYIWRKEKVKVKVEVKNLKLGVSAMNELVVFLCNKI